LRLRPTLYRYPAGFAIDLTFSQFAQAQSRASAVASLPASAPRSATSALSRRGSTSTTNSENSASEFLTITSSIPLRAFGGTVWTTRTFESFQRSATSANGQRCRRLRGAEASAPPGPCPPTPRRDAPAGDADPLGCCGPRSLQCATPGPPRHRLSRPGPHVTQWPGSRVTRWRGFRRRWSGWVDFGQTSGLGLSRERLSRVSALSERDDRRDRHE